MNQRRSNRTPSRSKGGGERSPQANRPGSASSGKPARPGYAGKSAAPGRPAAADSPAPQRGKSAAPGRPAAAGSPAPQRGKPAQPGRRPQAPRIPVAPADAAAVKPASAAGRKPAKPKETVLTATEPAELLDFLLAHLPGGRNHIKAILTRGQVSVGGRQTTRHNQPVRAGQKVTVSWTKTFEAEILRGLTILHEDGHLLVVEKEAGLLSVASEQEKQETAYAMLTAYVRREHPKNRIFVVHRLDRETSGVMIFAKTEEVQQALQNAWTEAVEARTYVALVEGHVRKPEDTITSWLKESKTLKMYSSDYENDGQKAVTHYKVLQAGRDYSLLELELETGRKNQIRVHMEDIGHPIAGDRKYSARTNPLGRLGLHAQAIAFHHPVTGKLERYESKIPKSFMKLLD